MKMDSLCVNILTNSKKMKTDDANRFRSFALNNLSDRSALKWNILVRKELQIKDFCLTKASLDKKSPVRIIIE